MTLPLLGILHLLAITYDGLAVSLLAQSILGDQSVGPNPTELEKFRLVPKVSHDWYPHKSSHEEGPA